MSLRATKLQEAGLQLRLVLMVAGIVLATLVAVGLTTLTAFDRSIAPELAKRAQLIGSLVRSELQRVQSLGIPFEAMTGLDRYLLKSLQDFSEVERIAVVSESGRTIALAERPPSTGGLRLQSGSAARTGAVRLPVLEGNSVVGQVEVNLDPRVVQSRLHDIFLDVLVIGLAATLVAVELVLALIAASVGGPIERIERLLEEQANGNFQRSIPVGGIGALGRIARRLNDRAEDLALRLATLPKALKARFTETGEVLLASGRPVPMRLSQVADIRLPLFLYSAATEVASAFMPIYARSASRPDWLSAELAAAGPLLAYLAALALLSPLGGRLASHFGPRRLFLVSLPPSIVALLGMGFSESLLGIMLWRTLLAVFYATATIACQEYAMRANPTPGGIRSTGAFLRVVFAGVLCGATLGGILAGRFGFPAAFIAGATIGALSFALGSRSLQGDAGDPLAAEAPAQAPARRRPTLAATALLICVVAPMYATTAIFVWYLAPLMLAAGGAGPAEITRVVMLYYLVAVAAAPVVTHLAEGRLGERPMIGLGILGSCATLFALPPAPTSLHLMVATVALGLSHAFQRAPQYAQARRLAASAGSSPNALRTVERLGAIAGLAASALLLDTYGSRESLQALASIVLVAALAYVLIEFASRRRST